MNFVSTFCVLLLFTAGITSEYEEVSDLMILSINFYEEDDVYIDVNRDFVSEPCNGFPRRIRLRANDSNAENYLSDALYAYTTGSLVTIKTYGCLGSYHRLGPTGTHLTIQ